MTRYATRPILRPVAESLKPSLTVPGRKETNTGLVSAQGDPIYRLQDPIGFGREGER